MAKSPRVRRFHYAMLQTAHSGMAWQKQYAAIESGLADYFSCSFLGTPKFAEISAKVFNPNAGYLRLLANDKKFTEFASIQDVQMPYQGAEIWGGLFWAIRDRTSRDVADPVFVAAWHAMQWPAEEARRAPAFVDALRAAARSRMTQTHFDAVEEILRAREFPITR